jgi:hypothetical protein
LITLGALLLASSGTISPAQSGEPAKPERRPVSFRTEVAPLLSKAGCNMGACHGNSSGKGGFRLSLRGDDPDFDFQSLTRESLGRRICSIAPDRSLAIQKPTGLVPHEGGIRFAASSPEAEIFRDWIAAGATDDRSTAARVSSLAVEPVERIVTAPDRSVQLHVTARFDDGSTRDVTRLAAFDLSDPTRAEVSPTGRITARRDVELTVAVRYLKGRGVSRLAFLPERPGFLWNAPAAANEVDVHVFGRLRALQIEPSKPATDPVFLRRAYLDAIGRLPSPAETRAFLADHDARKRSKLIDDLLDRLEFADFWALKWADLLRNEEKTMGSKGVWVFQRWLRDQIAADVPLDEMTRKIVTARGSTWENPPSSFYRTNRDPMTAAETVAQVFLGIRLQCARCHNHPFDDLTQDDYYGLAAYFSNIERKQVNNVRRDKLDRHEINGDEVIYLSGMAGMDQPRSLVHLAPRPPGGPVCEPAQRSHAVDHLANWLTRNNRQFATNLANRTWFHLMGRGIVEPVDDFRESNPPSNPALLGCLTDHMIRHGMRLRPLIALIMNSQTYQLDATPTATNAADSANFSHSAVRPLPAEVLLDAISDTLEAHGQFPRAPRRLRAVQFPGVAAGNAFLSVFGKPERLLTCECERNDTTTLAQAFQMLSGEVIRPKLEDPDNRFGRLVARNAPAESILEDLYLAALCRRPTPEEQAGILSHVHRASSLQEAWQDVAWAIINSKEFLLRH